MVNIQSYLNQVALPQSLSHKGQNGKLLIIGGSDLFHAASKWSLDVASHFVDMVFYSSVPLNNELVKEAKGEFWNGIVVPREELSSYLTEADCVLIGPGMTRSSETAEVTNELLKKYPDKRWVIDAGALQMVEEQLLHQQCILTPHVGEWQRFLGDFAAEPTSRVVEAAEVCEQFMHVPVVKHNGVTVVLKGSVDYVFNQDFCEAIEGGNAGMTKGGTGDVLAGIIAALACTNDLPVAAVVGSYVNKKAGEFLYESMGPYFNASELVEAVPKVMWQLMQAKK